MKIRVHNIEMNLKRSLNLLILRIHPQMKHIILLQNTLRRRRNKKVNTGKRSVHRWYSFVLCDKRRYLKAKKNNYDKLKDECRKLHNLFRRSMKRANEFWLEWQCNQIVYDLSKGVNSKKAYNMLKINNWHT